jgi:hypothetical protein
MQKNQLKKIFHLEGYILDEVEDREGKILLHCHLQKKSMKFESEVSDKVNTTRERSILHSIFEGKQVYIRIIQRKFYFSKSNKRLWEELPSVKKKQQMTSTFKKTAFWR